MLDGTPATTLGSVLTRLNDALEKGDAKAAAALFQADSYWRDLVAFTWNLRTMEGPDQIRAMLESQLAQIRPGSLRLDPNEPPTASGDVTEGWIEFEHARPGGGGHQSALRGRMGSGEGRPEEGDAWARRWRVGAAITAAAATPVAMSAAVTAQVVASGWMID